MEGFGDPAAAPYIRPLTPEQIKQRWDDLIRPITESDEHKRGMEAILAQERKTKPGRRRTLSRPCPTVDEAKLKRLRLSAGLTQAKLAELAQVSVSTIARAEKGQWRWELRDFEQVAAALNKAGKSKIRITAEDLQEKN